MDKPPYFLPPFWFITRGFAYPEINYFEMGYSRLPGKQVDWNNALKIPNSGPFRSRFLPFDILGLNWKGGGREEVFHPRGSTLVFSSCLLDKRGWVLLKPFWSLSNGWGFRLNGQIPTIFTIIIMRRSPRGNS